MSITSTFQAQLRALLVEAALTDDNKSRVTSDEMRGAVESALSKADLSLRVFSTGSVGTQVPIKIVVTNDSGETFDLSGQIILTIKETRAPKTVLSTTAKPIGTAVIDQTPEEVVTV